MSFLPQLRLFSGLVAMAAVLVLTSPGVRVAGADDLVSTDPALVERFLAQTREQGPTAASCDAAAKGDRANEMAVARAEAELKEQIAKMEQAAQLDPSKVAGIVTLNNRGFNYSGGVEGGYGLPQGLPAQ